MKNVNKWDIQDYLKTPEDIAHYLEAAFEDGSREIIATAIGDVVRAKGMVDIANKAGLTREGLYKPLSKNGDPKLSTLLSVLKALDLHLYCRPREKNLGMKMLRQDK